MIQAKTDYQVASFYLDDQKISLVPSEMKAESDKLCFEKNGLKAYLFFESKNEYSLWTLSFENTSAENSGQISNIRTLDMDFPASKTVNLHTLKGDNASIKSFEPVDKDILAPFTAKPNGGRSSCTTGFPFFDIQTGESAYLFAIGWTGQWIYTITPGNGTVNVSAGLEYADFYLKPGESVRCASIFLLEGEEQTALRRLFKKIQFRDFNAVRQTGKDTLPFAIQPYDRYFYGKCPEWPTEQGQLKTLAAAVKCEHLDTLWLDAAWFKLGFPRGVGNYTFESGYPNGLKPISDAVHKENMKFLLWFEPERVYNGSDLFEQHQDFLLEADDSNTRLYDLGNPDAWNWLYNTLKNFIADNGLDIYRQDCNINLLGYWLTNDEKGRQGLKEIKHIEGLYRLWDALRADFPTLMIDNCASGGRRLDFESIRRAAPLWRSDIACRPATEKAHTYTWSQNHTLALGEYLQYHACAAWEPIAYHVRSAATTGLACTFDVLKPDYNFEQAKKACEEAARLAKKYLTYDFYPMSEYTLDETGFAAWRYENQTGGCVYIFRRDKCTEDMYVLKLPSVDKNATYKLTIADEQYNSGQLTVSGAELFDGFAYKTEKPCESAVIEYEKI
ncbi:MAG: alpha-galactosidase [Clostridia bacterium]|nr:alpha-galactosidase [Clostridia bacterium]